MAPQLPLITFGDTVGIDIYTITQLKGLCKYYHTSQGVPQEVAVVAQWVRTKPPLYPAVGVMTTIDEYAPSSMSDLVAQDPNGYFAAEYNDIEINMLIQAPGLRELANLRSYLYLNVKYGADPFTGKQWQLLFANNGIMLNSWRVDPPEQTNLDVAGNLSLKPMANSDLERTDIEILWQQRIAIQANAQLGVIFDPDVAGIIRGINFNITLDESNLISEGL